MCVRPAVVSNYRLTAGVGTALPYGGDVVASPPLMRAIITRTTTGFALAFDCSTCNVVLARFVSPVFSEEAFPSDADDTVDLMFISSVCRSWIIERESGEYSVLTVVERCCPWCWSAATSPGNNGAAGTGASGLCWVYLSLILISASLGCSPSKHRWLITGGDDETWCYLHERSDSEKLQFFSVKFS